MPCGYHRDMSNGVLHLVDAGSPVAHPAGLAMLRGAMRQSPQWGHQVVVLGGQRLARDATATGLEPAARAGVPQGRPSRGPAAVAAALRKPGVGLAEAGTIHCWSIDSFATARLLFPNKPRLLTLLHRPSEAGLRLLRWCARRSRVPALIATPSPTIAGRLLTAGIDPKSVTGLAPFEPVHHGQLQNRVELRRRWALDAGIPEETTLVALVGEPPAAADAGHGLLVAGLARESLASRYTGDGARGDLMLLAYPTARRRARAEQHLGLLGRGHFIRQMPGLDRPWQVLPGCDLALILGEAPATLPWAAASGTAIAAECQPLNREWLSHNHNAMLLAPGVAKQAAHALSRLVTEPGLADRLSGAAATGLGAPRFGHEPSPTLAELYERLIGDNKAPATATIASTLKTNYS